MFIFVIKNFIKKLHFLSLLNSFHYYIFKTNESKKKTIKDIKNKFSSINNLNLLQKLIADCYNHICYDTIKIISRKIYEKKKFIKIYYEFYI
jgi:hypothetical protein